MDRPGDGLLVELIVLTCEECGAEADDQARGWQALHGEEDDGEVLVATFCPECAEREFGDNRMRRTLEEED